MPALKISTRRLDLIAGTAEIFGGEVNDRALLERVLQACVPESWPPEHYEPHVLEWCATVLAENAAAAGWTLWYIVLRETASGGRTVIGTIGCKGVPDAEGTAEIGYSVLPEFQRAGYATEAVDGLLSKLVFSHPQVRRVIAETYPELLPSIRVLEKSGFRFIGDGSEERVIRYELTRAEHEQATAII